MRPGSVYGCPVSGADSPAQRIRIAGSPNPGLELAAGELALVHQLVKGMAVVIALGADGAHPRFHFRGSQKLPV